MQKMMSAKSMQKLMETTQVTVIGKDIVYLFIRMVFCFICSVLWSRDCCVIMQLKMVYTFAAYIQVGEPRFTCQWCGALMWMKRVYASNVKLPTRSFQCVVCKEG